MNKTPEVDAWFDAYDNPMKPVVMAIRDVILSADDRIAETIKWQAPTFVYKGNIASFFPRAKKNASLMFHTGATIPGDFSILEGDGKEARSVKIKDLDELDAKSEELKSIVAAWCEMKDG